MNLLSIITQVSYNMLSDQGNGLWEEEIMKEDLLEIWVKQIVSNWLDMG